MSDGCTNPYAVNYDPTATQDNGSCIYLNKVAGVCYAFADVSPDEVIDRSFTLSWSVIDNNWVFYHDYIPDFYFSTREQLFNLKNGRVYQFNAGPPGVYHDGTTKSFFVDVVFNSDKEMTLNAINWITEVLNQDGSDAPFDTLTHVTVWNSYQCSGRIALSQVYQDLEYEVRKTAGKWNFDDFRNQLTTEGIAFLQDLFHNFDVVTGQINTQQPWYDKEVIEDNYFVIRFEFDNTTGKKIYINDTNIDVNPSFR